jgi:adenylate cyclase
MYYKSINDVSSYVIDQSNSLLLEKVQSLKDEVQLIVEFVKGSLYTKAEITGDDPDYVKFLVNILRTDPVLTAVMVGTPQGEYFSVMNAKLDSGMHFYSRPKEKLPSGVLYIVRTISRNHSIFEEKWTYVDKHGTALAEETLIPASVDFQKNPWIQKMIEDPKLLWSNELLPRGVSEKLFKRAYSVTVSDVLKDAQGNIVAAFSVGVSLKNLSQFIDKQKIGKNGFAFLVDGEGVVKVPLPNEMISQDSYQKMLIEEGYHEFKKNQKNAFILQRDEEKYLFSIQDSGIFHDDPWFIAIAVPFNDFFGEMIWTQKITTLMSLIILIASGLITCFCVKRISKPVVRMVSEVDEIRNFNFSKQRHAPSHIKEIFDLESSIDAMRSALHSFGRYVPREVVRTLVKYGRDVVLGGKREELTVMFTDIENFTTISESLPIEQLMTTLSEYFDVISKIILQEDGTIDKYIGDSVMSFWGAPIPMVNHAEKACLTGLRLLATIQQQNKWTTRFGIHTGEVIVGNIGTSERMNYTIIGDVVNVAARLQSINKEYQTLITISEIVHKKIGPEFVTRPIDFVAVKGKKTKLKIYELMGTKGGELAASSAQRELSELFTCAYEKFEEGNLEEALKCFLLIENKFPEDGPTKKYISRLNHK